MHLSSSFEYTFNACNGASPWLREFSHILQLSETQNKSQNNIWYWKQIKKKDSFDEILFSIQKECDHHLPDSQWELQDFRCLAFYTHPDASDLICVLNEPVNETIKYIQMYRSLQPIYKKLLNAGCLPVHAACANLSGKGIIIAAPGNTGKSTCSRRLPTPWKSLCDDETLIMKHEKGFYLHPFPTWSDYFEQRTPSVFPVEKSTPCSALFFLEQGTQDQVTLLPKSEATVRLCEAAKQMCNGRLRSHKKEDTEYTKMMYMQIFNTACVITKDIPAYQLQATKNGRFWEHIESILK